MNMKITREKNQKIWFTSDLHFYHKNICGPLSTWKNAETARPFDDIKKMNEFILNQINSVVKENDYLFIIGDLCFGKLIDRKSGPTDLFDSFCNIMRNMNGIKYVLKGNHDDYRVLCMLHKNRIIENWGEYLELRTQYIQCNRTRKVNVVAMHYPIISWNGMGTKKHGSKNIHLFGHTHNTLKLPEELSNHPMMDCGIDNEHYMPYDLDDIVSNIMKDKFPIKLDHHTE